jgi:BirA family biotin operon repressor/biotin-[acetyl-CoA-carboxylase] ligase
LPVCASTETVLDRSLTAGCQPPLAVLAGRQRFGHGQRGRPWISPPGGVWVSAALPWPACTEQSAALGLAVAVGLALQLEALGLPVQLKWPNDLLVCGHKLAGLLPRQRLRGGRIRSVRVGVGLNGRNRVPTGATSLGQLLGRSSPASAPPALAARLLAAFDWAVIHAADPEGVRQAAGRRLWQPEGGVIWEGEPWQPLGLSRDGGLLLGLGARRITLTSGFGP